MSVDADIPRVRPKLEILLVEDNAGDAFLLLKYFEKSKFPNNVRVTRDGEDALNLIYQRHPYLNARRPDIIFLDLNLPRKDGRDILREIKTDPHLREIPVIVLTSSGLEQDVIEAYEYHANFYMIKPTDINQFIASMNYVEEFWLKTIVPSEK